MTAFLEALGAAMAIPALASLTLVVVVVSYVRDRAHRGGGR